MTSLEGWKIWSLRFQKLHNWSLSYLTYKTNGPYVISITQKPLPTKQNTAQSLYPFAHYTPRPKHKNKHPYLSLVKIPVKYHFPSHHFSPYHLCNTTPTITTWPPHSPITSTTLLYPAPLAFHTKKQTQLVVTLFPAKKPSRARIKYRHPMDKITAGKYLVGPTKPKKSL